MTRRKHSMRSLAALPEDSTDNLAAEFPALSLSELPT